VSQIADQILHLSGWRSFGFDRPVLDFFTRHRTRGLTDAVQVVTVLGSAVFIIPATIGVGALARWRLRTWRPVVLPAGAYAGAALLQSVIKSLVARPRPPAGRAVAHYGGWSFPSGHATQAAAWWGAMALVVALATPSWRRRVIAWTVALVVTVLVGLTRCYLGAHWASDVIGGWVLGWAWLGAIGALAWATMSRPPAAAPEPEAESVRQLSAPEHT